jgi:hypothetical protein
LRTQLTLAAIAFALAVAAPAAADEPAPAPATPVDAAPVEEPPKVELQTGKIPEGRIGTQKLLGAVAGAIGFLTTAVGGFLVISSLNLYHEAESRCESRGCSTSDVDDGNKARSRANAGGIVLVTGLAVVGGGIALWFTAPPKPGAKKSAAALGIAPTLGGLSAGGTF